MFDLGFTFLIIWILKNAAVDVTSAVKGTPNPRYEYKMAKAKAAGQHAPTPPRYGGRQWWNDFYSDALEAQTKWRRERSARKDAEKAKREEQKRRDTPVDEMLGVIADKPPARKMSDPDEWLNDREVPTLPATRCRKCGHLTVNLALADGHERCIECGWQHPEGCDGNHKVRVDWGSGPIRCQVCNGALVENNGQWVHPPDAVCPPPLSPRDKPTDTAQPAAPAANGATRLAPVVNLFPNAKETTMGNAEATGLMSAIAFAENVDATHRSFAADGGETYLRTLAEMGMGDSHISSAREAMEASTVAAEKWAAHAEGLKSQLGGREFYQSNPDAADKQALINE